MIFFPKMKFRIILIKLIKCSLFVISLSMMSASILLFAISNEIVSQMEEEGSKAQVKSVPFVLHYNTKVNI
jgi:hypothetical protein